MVAQEAQVCEVACSFDQEVVGSYEQILRDVVAEGCLEGKQRFRADGVNILAHDRAVVGALVLHDSHPIQVG